MKKVFLFSIFVFVSLSAEKGRPVRIEGTYKDEFNAFELIISGNGKCQYNQYICGEKLPSRCSYEKKSDTQFLFKTVSVTVFSFTENQEGKDVITEKWSGAPYYKVSDGKTAGIYELSPDYAIDLKKDGKCERISKKDSGETETYKFTCTWKENKGKIVMEELKKSEMNRTETGLNPVSETEIMPAFIKQKN
ncbi:MAG TPA: hypothetical protein PK683_22655 [Leptospiraceae bacterium]|nr:hypothetical protein [Leptospiraceae bacterium]HNH11318.1 hypothetical protein [Leptospiraceae bacterium]